ncbi:putative serine protease PepD [Actinomadura namibiensis]|uniref:Putative serine protease PepD n=1 Tax=Actinomadura namibiensis TaxID=182080 RepID=A0A7W3LWE4_ACTNM|nr:trypsin-like peptidase domain-containing protein [Actinomadura namibiensis]MBA8955492.1 putative serine protease PepD [Actinomadura namibiensis]
MTNRHPEHEPYTQPSWTPPTPAFGPRPEPAPAKTGWSLRRRAAAVAAAAALAVGAGGAGAAIGVAAAGPGAARPVAVTGASTGSGTTARVAAAVQPSVVSIDTGSGSGSGVVLRADGTILTNAHVVSGADQVTVKFSDGRTARARVLGTDAARDIAVIKAAGVSGLTPVTFGDSDAVRVGDPVLAIGSPLGLDGSVTSGIVSALGRSIQEGDSGGNESLPPFLRDRTTRRQQAVIEDAIQTDAAINPGNSGGALVDGAGRLIGINTAIATSGGGSGSIGVGFAIPANDARKVAEQIIARAGT